MRAGAAGKDKGAQAHWGEEAAPWSSVSTSAVDQCCSGVPMGPMACHNSMGWGRTQHPHCGTQAACNCAMQVQEVCSGVVPGSWYYRLTRYVLWGAWCGDRACWSPRKLLIRGRQFVLLRQARQLQGVVAAQPALLQPYAPLWHAAVWARCSRSASVWHFAAAGPASKSACAAFHAS